MIGSGILRKAVCSGFSFFTQVQKASKNKVFALKCKKSEK